MPKPAKTIKEYFRESISNANLFFELYNVNLCKVDIPELSCIMNVYSCKIRKFRKFDQRRVDKINKQPELLVVMEKGEDFIADETTYNNYTYHVAEETVEEIMEMING